MSKKTGSGMQICRKTSRTGSEWQEGVLSALLFCALGGTLCELTGFFSLGTAAAALAAGLGVCAVQLALKRLGREQWALPAVLGSALLLTAITVRDVTDGFCLMWNRACAEWTAASGQLILGLSVSADQPRQKLCLILFSVIAGVLLALFSTAAVRHFPRVTAALTVMVPVALWLLQRQQCTMWTLALLLCAAWLAMYAGWQKSGGGSGKMTAICAAGFAALLALCFFALQMVPAVRDNRFFAEQRQALLAAVHEFRYETDGTSLPEGDFSKPVQNSGNETALLVTMEKPEKMYLRGFVGDTFDGALWLPTQQAQLAENAQLLYWLHKDGFYPQAQLEQAATLPGLTETPAQQNQITVENQQACRKYIYTPCTLRQESLTENLPLLRLSDGAITANGLRGQQKYTFTVLSDPEELLSPLLTLLEERKEDNAVLQYRKEESSYRELAETMDLALPESAIDQMKDALDECCGMFGSADGLTPEQAQASALLFLKQYCAAEQAATDTLQLPLEKTAAGTSYQYATAAVLALRYYGIPARYAEGYVISDELASTAQPGEAFRVDASCAQAWAEVYQDGVGWMPLQMTPGYDALTGELEAHGIQPTGTGKEDNDAPDGTEAGDGNALTEGKELEPDEEQQDTQQQEQNQSGLLQQTKLLRSHILLILLLMAMLLLAAGILYLRRKQVLLRRRAQFFVPDRSSAIGWLFSDAARLLEQLGLRRGNESMLQLCGQLQSRFDSQYASSYREMIALNGEALFSSHPMSEEQWKAAAGFHEKTVGLFQTQLSVWKRLWAKWILCLY